MTDKIKQAARHIQDVIGCPYTTALNILRGNIRPIPRSNNCIVKAAFDTMPDKLKSRLPELGKEVEGKPKPKPCTCARCEKD